MHGLSPYIYAQSTIICHWLHLLNPLLHGLGILTIVAGLAQSIAHQSLRSYLLAIRTLHIVKQFGNPMLGYHRLDLALKGVRCAKVRPTRTRLPITPLLMSHIHETLMASLNYHSMGSMLYGHLWFHAVCMGNGSWSPKGLSPQEAPL